ncbi:hypothetical protein PanWU01x14_129630 [Parasponia andersonii]|uniref:Hydroxyproline-rich glycoprotein family protein n=1 Tax=Parasponia andersonii TaxID=3476 RepID=A0A2P5CRH4_PARAD|nr:hypothetical protein PanWU01x14_129630 [Parasponia andersonii]
MALSLNLSHLLFLALLLLCGLTDTCQASRLLLDDLKMAPSTVQVASKPSISPPSESANVTKLFSFPAIPKIIPTIPTFPFIPTLPNSVPLVPLPPGFQITTSDSLLLTDEKKPSGSGSSP